MSIFDTLKKSKKGTKGIPKLVIGINQVDNLGEWDNSINQPTPETEEKIKARANDIIEKLTSGTHGASKEQIEYFSALRAYRLPQVINKIIHCTGIITTFKPKEITDPACSEGMPDDNRHEIDEMIKSRRAKAKKMGIDDFIAQVMEKLDDKQKAEFRKVIQAKKAKPINVAIIGQSGVGKSTTVNNLFGAKERVSRTGEGTTTDNYGGYKEYSLDDGSIMRVADLPGYGRGLNEEELKDSKEKNPRLVDILNDEKYKTLYINTLKECDVILLIIQANDKAIADDQYMVECLYEWSKEGFLTDDGTYYGQDTGLEEYFAIKKNENDKCKKEPEEDAPKEQVTITSEKLAVIGSGKDYLQKIEDICIEAMSSLDKSSSEYEKVKNIFKLL